VRFEDPLVSHTRGDHVLLMRLEGRVVGIVAEQAADVQALEAALRPVLPACARR
jgi:hypothetical protein